MNIKNFIVTIITFLAIGFLSYVVVNAMEVWDTGLWFLLTGIFNTIAFIIYMTYNPVYSDAAKPKRVMSGDKMVDNADRNSFDFSKSSGNSYADDMGYGFYNPNIVGLGVGVLFILIGIIL